MRWNDLTVSSVDIRRNLTHAHHRASEGSSETPSGQRTVILPAFVVETVAAQRKQQAACRLKIGDTWSGDGRVFTTRTGTAPTRNSLREKFRAECRAAGVPEMKIHNLRHVAASLLIAAGTDIKVTQQRLGHSTAQIILDIYAHVITSGDTQAATQMDRLLTAPTRRTKKENRPAVH